VVAAVKPIIADLGDVLTEVEVDGTRAWIRTEDLEAIRATRPRPGGVQLVGGFDPLIVGAGLREQLLPPAHLKRISRTAGWISPVVLVDGRAAGVWDSRRTSRGLTVTVEMFDRSSPARRAAIERAAGRIGQVQGLPVAVEFGRVFVEKRRKLVIEPGDA
jgi:hypothetical protein